MLLLLVAVVLSYLLGSCPFGLWIARAVRGVNLREVGSGNIGATNASRALGTKWGLIVLLLDALKGALPALLARSFLAGDVTVGPYAAPACGLAAIVGHMCPIFLGFRGGKGVATSLGAGLIVAPKALGAAGLVFILAFAGSRIVSLSSLLAIGAFAIIETIAYAPSVPAPQALALLLFTWVVTPLTFWRHEANIQRLIAGTEPRFTGRKTSASDHAAPTSPTTPVDPVEPTESTPQTPPASDGPASEAP